MATTSTVDRWMSESYEEESCKGPLTTACRPSSAGRTSAASRRSGQDCRASCPDTWCCKLLAGHCKGQPSLTD